MFRPAPSALLLLLAVTACHGAPDRTGQIMAANPNVQDPALTTALADPIMVDPSLSRQADNRIAGRTPMPLQAGLPLARPTAPDPGPLLAAPPPVQSPSSARQPTLATFVAAQESKVACQAPLHYSAAWAARMPGAIPIYPEGQVQMAAGLDSTACQLRIVQFVTAAPPGQVIDFYYTHARRAGFDARYRLHGTEHVLAGGNPAAHADYVVVVAPDEDGNSDITLLTSVGS